MTKKEMFKAIYYYFLNTVYAYYLVEGQVDKEIFKYSLERLKERARELGLTAVAERNGEDIILIVEKPEEYVIVSADLDIYTYKDEEMEAEC